MPLSPNKTLFESKFCGRCGGSGSYSYNPINGTTCFGCAGQGVQLTKRGQAAQRFYRELCSSRADELKVGDVVQFDMFYYRCWAPVTAIEPAATPGQITVRAIRKRTGESIGYTCGADTLFRRCLTAEQKAPLVAQARAFQDTLTKLGKPRKAAAQA